MLSADIIFVNRVAVLITHSKNIGLIMTECLLTWMTRQIAKQKLNVCTIYYYCSFKIQTMLMDNEFNKVQSE